MLQTGKSLITAFILLSLMSGTALAGRAKNFDGYIVYYNALTTDILEPTVARQYKIKRSKNRAMINISVQQKQKGQMGKSVAAEIKGTAVNLSGHTKVLKTRKIKEGDAIYYIDDFNIAHNESMKFNIIIKPEGENKTYTLKFRQKFYTK